MHRITHPMLWSVRGLLLAALSLSLGNAAHASNPSNPSNPSNASERFALNGMTHLGDSWGFSVKDLSNQSSFWIELNQTLGDIQASAYDPEAKVLTLLIAGSPVQVALSEASGEPLTVARSVNMAGYAEYEIPETPTGTPPPPPNGGARPPTAPPETAPAAPDLRNLRKGVSSR